MALPLPEMHKDVSARDHQIGWSWRSRSSWPRIAARLVKRLIGTQFPNGRSSRSPTHGHWHTIDGQSL